MNCVNCGAPAAAGASDCRYCGSGLRVLRTEVNRARYDHLLKMVRDCDFDTGRVVAVETYMATGEMLTAGQVRNVLAAFDFDSGRLKAASMLRDRTLNLTDLSLAGDVFDHDSSRQGFFRLLTGQPAKGASVLGGALDEVLSVMDTVVDETDDPAGAAKRALENAERLARGANEIADAVEDAARQVSGKAAVKGGNRVVTQRREVVRRTSQLTSVPVYITVGIVIGVILLRLLQIYGG